MHQEKIRTSLEAVAAHFHAHPEEALSEDKPATAVLEQGLRFSVSGLGSWVVTTDMPSSLGGEASAPSPGWLRRAAQAACEATMIAIAAAKEGISLKTLEVTIGSQSDDRGLVAAAEVPAGPLESWARVKIAAEGVTPGKLRELVEWAEAHSPVTDALCRAVPHRLEIDSQ
jgi:uncharacterized OsmC-like protein